MSNIGIIGAGTAGLHLGLRLLAQGVPVTLYTERDPALLRSSRLPNTVFHNAHTRARERALAVNHWDAPDFGVFQSTFYAASQPPLRFRGRLQHPALFVDYRLYQPRLAEDFVARGGRLVIEPMEAADVHRLAQGHELVVVASGRGSLSSLFPPRPELSPHSSPQRLLFICLTRGIRYPEPVGMGLNLVPGHGEIFDSPMLSFEGRVTSLLVEAIPGGVLEPLATRSYEENPRAFEALLLEVLRQYAPEVYSRVDTAQFGILRPLDVMQGAITPVIRHGYASLESGRFALALGDAHVLNDPVGGQGANAASGAAWVLAEAIGEHLAAGRPFDEAFCQAAQERTWAVARIATDWSNFMLWPPPHMSSLMQAASQDETFAEALTNTLLEPAQALVAFATPESTASFIAQHGKAPRPATASALA